MILGSAAGGFLRETTLSPEEFLGRDLLLREKGSGARDVFDRVMESRGLQVEPVWEAESTAALLNAAEQGLGITVLPEAVAENSLKEGRTVLLHVEGIEFLQKFYVVYHKDKILTDLMADFIRQCR